MGDTTIPRAKEHSMTTRDEVGRRIRQAREELGISQAELGRRLKRARSHAAVSDMERGEVKLDIEELADLASVLERDLSHFILPQTSLVLRRGDYRQSEIEKAETASAIEEFKAHAKKKLGVERKP
jgi:transcriptional regulator with XRE-family HTH domain